MPTDDRERAARMLADAANWLAHVARVRSEADRAADPRGYPLPPGGYLGAVRNEYDTATGSWSLNGPVWHSGQAARAVLLAERRTGDATLREAALAIGDYLRRATLDTPGEPLDGLLLAYEGDAETVNLQTMFETLPGLFDLADATGDASWDTLARRAADAALHGFDAREGLIADHLHVAERRFVIDPDNVLPGRIALDDSALALLSDRSGDPRYRAVFLAMAERALRDEDPAGTWIVYPPWHRDSGRQHIRASWWWGRPMLTAFDLTGDARFLACAMRAGEWYLRQQHLDGGFPYAPLVDGRHATFAVATSGSAVSAILWADLWERSGEERWLAAIRRSLRFLFAAAFPADHPDANLRGALWETLNVPDGTTAPGYRVRDIAPIFAVRAIDRLLDLDAVWDEPIRPLDNVMVW